MKGYPRDRRPPIMRRGKRVSGEPGAGIPSSDNFGSRNSHEQVFMAVL
jgi:hypothetical protein